MDEWWTYSLTDFLLFSPNSFFRQFELYNEAIWPSQFLAIAFGLMLFKHFFGDDNRGYRLSAALLSIGWLWVAWAYFHDLHAEINLAAPYFAVAFAFQFLLLLASGLKNSEAGDVTMMVLRPRQKLRQIGGAYVLVGVFLYPLVGFLAGRTWMQAEIFGLVPNPTVVATLGILLTAPRLRGILMVIPLAWCAISGATRLALEAPDFWVMPLAGTIALFLVIQDTIKSRSHSIA